MIWGAFSFRNNGGSGCAKFKRANLWHGRICGLEDIFGSLSPSLADAVIWLVVVGGQSALLGALIWVEDRPVFSWTPRQILPPHRAEGKFFRVYHWTFLSLWTF